MPWQRLTSPGRAVQRGLAPLVPAVWQLLVLAASNEPAVMPRVGVLVRNSAQAPAETIQKAEAECRRILQAAGILTLWINAAEDVDWRGPDLVLRVAILPRPPESRRITAFGTALPEKQSGLQVFIYYDRVSDLSRRAEVPVHVVFAGALAHEIGHMLLRSTEHSLAGIMRADWDRRELQELERGVLRFTAEQKRQMRSYLDNVRLARAQKEGPACR